MDYNRFFFGHAIITTHASKVRAKRPCENAETLLCSLVKFLKECLYSAEADFSKFVHLSETICGSRSHSGMLSVFLHIIIDVF